jgi:glycosyltransferase involved in cell wall biosynthesis
MRLLSISNYYPPFELGGWEQLAQEINQLLDQRGHITTTLTSHYRAGELNTREPEVFRLLNTDSEDLAHYHPAAVLRKPAIDRENQHILEEIVAQFRPDVILVHSMWNLSTAVVWKAEQLLPGRVVYYVASQWPYLPDAHATYWSASTRRGWLNVSKKFLAAPVLYYLERERRDRQLKFEHVLCVSQHVRNELARFANIPFERSRVVYNGVNTQQFQPPQGWMPGVWKHGSPSFLCAGGLYPHKGTHVAIEGFALALKNAGSDCPEMQAARLTIVGSGKPDYEARLKSLVAELQLENHVHFLGRVGREQMPGLIQQYDILLMPSMFEPLSRMMQEGMACGLAVIGTVSGGSAEILQDGVTGLAFTPGDSAGLAAQIQRLITNAGLRNQIARNGRQAVLEKFSMDRMVDEIEGYLAHLSAVATPAG